MKRPRAAALVWIAAGLAALSVGLAAVPLPQRFAGESGLPPPDAAAPPSDAAAPVSIDPILELSPFGRVARALTGAPEAEETALGLTLHGVVIAQPADASRAIVSGGGAEARVYLVGEEVASGATLSAVFADHVVLDVAGRPETLSFPRPGPGEAPRVAQGAGGADEDDSGVAALAALVTGGGSEDDAEPEGPAEADAPPDAPAPPEDLEAQMEDFRLRIRDNPQTVLDDLGLAATDEGYRVGAAPSAMLLRAGLEPEDLVIKVNGQQVGNIETDREVFDDATASGHARVELVRDGRRMVLSFPLR